MDLAKEGKSTFRFNKKLITLLLNFPGVWLVYHLFFFGLENYDDKTGQLIEEFQEYRNKLYLFYAALIIGLSLLVIMRKNLNKSINSLKNSEQSSPLSVIIPVTIQGIILLTFAYVIAKFFLDFYFLLKKFI